MAEEFEPTLQKKERESKDYYEQPLALCIAQAEQSYEKYWFRECKSQGLLTKSCIEINEMPFEEYAKENNIPDDISTVDNLTMRMTALVNYDNEQMGCLCHLPTTNANIINKSLEDNRDSCFKSYPEKFQHRIR
ncbi:MAG: hypothetical protein ACD_24C00485G0009 [uncultured bacterium]|uniref:Uncharacterized protein n=1 Tax=candidate division WWE3 bacterium RBG_16_37_10 TaxID=1802610 RepID=A0A1F4V1B5_UNCKA|nr:MAG: hypothetical protein ACD_24C00485G0009 [uncultured bacterium]OGC50976.1 MAG: hypothetical protein A2W32_04115 [candidate division WWE3 bacterium RBG_16_37_10]HBH18564.1 hypothetical protein [Cyanobacteria bacterium UBA9579]